MGKDLIVNVDLAKKAKEDFSDGAKLFIIKDAGHTAMFDREEEYFSILSEILKWFLIFHCLIKEIQRSENV